MSKEDQDSFRFTIDWWEAKRDTNVKAEKEWGHLAKMVTADGEADDSCLVN